jgi:hypothetical protein
MSGSRTSAPISSADQRHHALVPVGCLAARLIQLATYLARDRQRRAELVALGDRRRFAAHRAGQRACQRLAATRQLHVQQDASADHHQQSSQRDQAEMALGV